MNVLVTGGAKGIGQAISLEFAAHGVNVAINYSKSEKQAEETIAKLEKLGVKAIAIKADVSKEDQVKKMVERAWTELGPLEFLVNNSGIYAETPGKPFYELTSEEWDTVMNVNTKGTWLVSKYVAAKMIEGKVKGSIVNISSIAGLDAARAGAHYGASKAAVISLTKSFCNEMGKHGIRVNSIAPGAVMTEMMARVPPEKNEHMRLETPLQKLSTTEDIAKAVYALANLSNVSGQTLIVDGGRLKH